MPPRMAWMEVRGPGQAAWKEGSCQNMASGSGGTHVEASLVQALASQRRIYQECHQVWQDGVPQTPETYWRLANAYRLVYHRNQWKRIQGHLLSLEAFASCSRTCDLIRAHRRSDARLEGGDLSCAAANYVLPLSDPSPSWCPAKLAHRVRCRRYIGMPRQQITDWKKGVSRLQGFEHLPLRRWAPASCVAALARPRTNPLGLHEALAGGSSPSSVQVRFLTPFHCRVCSQGWPHVWLRADAVGTAADSPLSSASAESTCFVCCQTPAKVGRRAGRLLGTARLLPGISSNGPIRGKHSKHAGLWQTSGQAPWHASFSVSPIGTCEAQGTVSEFLPGPHCFWMPQYPVRRGWTPWTRHALHNTCHGTHSRIRAYVWKLPVGDSKRRRSRRSPWYYHRTRGIQLLLRDWLSAHSCFAWALLAEDLLTYCLNGGPPYQSTHHTSKFESYLGPTSQGFANTLFFLQQQLAVHWRISDKGETEPRVERSAWESLSAEKLRHELLLSTVDVLADTRVPALCICDISLFMTLP